MIYLGLTSFNEHQTLTGKKQTTLAEYASYLPLVELDTAYYAIPKQAYVQRWTEQVPASFRFVMKAYGGITGQQDWRAHYADESAMIDAYLDSMAPMITSGHLYAFLLQFPGTFACTSENVAYLQRLRHWFKDLPVAIELRNNTWYTEQYLKRTLAFMIEQQFSLVIVDEPQIPTNPVPFLPYVTNPACTLFRLHGRNVQGWLANDAQWRKKRTLYRYNKQELEELSAAVNDLAQKSQQVAVVFNNNSGGDAADNARAMQKILGLDYPDLHPQQLGLF